MLRNHIRCRWDSQFGLHWELEGVVSSSQLSCPQDSAVPFFIEQLKANVLVKEQSRSLLLLYPERVKEPAGLKLQLRATYT